MSRPHGLYARNFPAAIRELVDCDYAHKLNEIDRAWLARFNDEFHGGCFKSEPLHADETQRREIWSQTKRLKRTDVLANASAAGVLLYSEQAETEAWDSAPSDEREWREPVTDIVHQAAVDMLWAAMPAPPKNQRARVVTTARHAAAIKRLVEVNQRQQAGLQRSRG